MTNILFVCLGNICRSPMAEFAMKDLVKKAGLENEYRIASAGTSSEEAGNPVYPPARRKLAEQGIDCGDKRARQVERSDYDKYDLILAMEERNIRALHRIFGGDPAGRIRLLLSYAGRGEGIADPWYTGDFEATWQDVDAGCRGVIKEISGVELP